MSTSYFVGSKDIVYVTELENERHVTKIHGLWKSRRKKEVFLGALYLHHNSPNRSGWEPEARTPLSHDEGYIKLVHSSPLAVPTSQGRNRDIAQC